MDKEISKSAAWSKFQSLRHILKGNFKLYHKDKIYNTCVSPKLTYGHCININKAPCCMNHSRFFAKPQNGNDGAKIKQVIHTWW